MHIIRFEKKCRLTKCFFDCVNPLRHELIRSYSLGLNPFPDVKIGLPNVLEDGVALKVVDS